MTEPFELDDGRLAVPTGRASASRRCPRCSPAAPIAHERWRAPDAAGDASSRGRSGSSITSGSVVARRRVGLGRRVAQPRPHHHDRVLGMLGVEAHHDRLGERRVAGVVLHDRDLFVARGLERVTQPEQAGREHRADRGAAELVDRPVRIARPRPRRPPAATSARPARRAYPSTATRTTTPGGDGKPVTVQPSGSTGTSRSGTVMPAPMALR